MCKGVRGVKNRAETPSSVIFFLSCNEKHFRKNYNSTGSYSITLPSAISGCIFFNWIKNDCLKEVCKTSANSSFACTGLRKILSDVCR